MNIPEHTYNKKLKSNAQTLRKNMTEEERILWYHFLNKLSIHFYRQRIIGKYIADFYCPKAKLVIELDGSQHFSDEGMAYDKNRDAFLQSKGLTVLRIPNNEIRYHLENVAEAILQYLPSDTTVVK